MNDSSRISPGTWPLDESKLNFRAWAKRHLQSLLAALGAMSRAPLASAMTAAVIGVALALPATIAIALANTDQITERWEGVATLTAFMELGVDQATVAATADAFRLVRAVDRVDITTPQDALDEYRAMAGDNGVLDALGETNPLPWVLLVMVRPDAATPKSVEALAEELSQRPSVEFVDFDLRWVTRLNAITLLGTRISWVVALVLAFAVLLVIGNTIRLEIEHKRNEIEVLQLVGATHAFVRRPFLYTGVWYGLFGALFAGCVVSAALAAVEGPVEALANAYGSSLRLLWPGIVQTISLLAVGAALGALGAWLSVSRYLLVKQGTRSVDL